MLESSIWAAQAGAIGRSAQVSAECLVERLRALAPITPMGEGQELGVCKTWRARALVLRTPRRIHSRPIWSTGLWRNIEDTAAINQTRRKRFMRVAIRSFWADCLWRKPWRKFDSPEECLEADYCFACGMLWDVPTDRSHIVARVWGGQDELSNIHLLCPLCHEVSELHQGMSYWRWLRRQNQFETVRWGMSRMLWTARLEVEGVTLDYGSALVLATAYMRYVRRPRPDQTARHVMSESSR
ncbi:MAG: HNH endonuclease [Phenylobacterium sp.]|nr:MAG: HNH endonuclease [Phenylobacterium sp.]